MKKYIRGILLLCIVALSAGLFLMQEPAESGETAGPSSDAAADLISGLMQDVPVPGKVTMVDLGAHKCIPCKMMAPIIRELSSEYDGKAAIVFIDVWENPDVPKQFGIRSIPTQIFYDPQGKERFRHQGFMDKESIVRKLTELGAQ